MKFNIHNPDTWVHPDLKMDIHQVLDAMEKLCRPPWYKRLACWLFK